MLTFNAIDVETANADRASICQIGIVHVVDGVIVDRWQTLVDPEAWFDDWNVRIHGLTPERVNGSPTMPEIRAELRRRLRGSILASHSSFDRVAFERAMYRYDIEQLQVTWLDSALVARRAWPEKFGRSGYGLKPVAYELGIEFRHHDALEDARASAEIVLAACRHSGVDVPGWVEKAYEPLPRQNQSGGERSKVARPQRVTRLEGNPDGILFGETVVFTGSLRMGRGVAAERAAFAGCNVHPTVTKKVTLLVVGVHDTVRLRGYDKSRKHRKAEELEAKGQNISIVSEADFEELLRTGQNGTPVRSGAVGRDPATLD